MKESQLPASASPVSVDSLVADTEHTVARVLRRMNDAGHGHHLGRVRQELSSALAEVGRWLADHGVDEDEELRESFRALAFRLRGLSVPLDEALEELEQLENALFGAPIGARGGGGADESYARARLRRALRILWTETFRVNHTLDRRRDRDRIDIADRFAEIISHELGNRLGAAQTGVLVLRDRDDLDPDRRCEILELISDGINAALETVDDVSALTEVHGLEENEGQPFREVAVRIARGLRPYARSNSVRIDIEPATLPEVEVDGGRLRLVLSNLMMNAIRYADRAEDEPFVRLEAGADQEALWFEVSDNGLGIAAADQPEIFKFQVRGREGNAEGSGMGLTIAREAVEQLGGDITLESSDGSGSTFRVELPLIGSRESSG